MPGMYTTGFKENGVDIGTVLVEKAYLIDVYPSLIPQAQSAGLICWGAGALGQLGDNTSISGRSIPAQTVVGGTNWRQISASGDNMGAIKSDGTLWMWGSNATYGALGDNTVVNKSSPVQTVSAGTNWKQVSCGGTHTAAIKTDGSLWLWGRNGDAQLGNNNMAIFYVSSPIQTVAGGTNWKYVCAGPYDTAAIKTDGTLWLWGSNTGGMLGDNTVVSKSSPVQTVAGGTNWKQVACASFHTAAIKTDGTLWTWGQNYGNLGDNTTTNRSSPVQTVAGGTNWKQVSCGGTATGAIKTDGTLWMWGTNTYGYLGTADTTTRSSPTQTSTGGTNWKQLSVGDSTTAAIKTDGTLWTWGYNFNYQLQQTGGTGSRSTPAQTIVNSSFWRQVSISSTGVGIVDFDA